MMQRRKPAVPDSSSSESQAQQAPHELDIPSSSPKPEEQEGEDLEEGQEADYQPIPELDIYEDEGVDDQVHELNPQARKAAEIELQRKDVEEMGEDPLDQFLAESNQEEDRLLIKAQQEFYEISSDEEDPNDGIDPQQERGSFGEWLLTPAVKRYIRRHFANFILKFNQNGKYTYFQRLKDMCINNLQSLQIEYDHFLTTNPKLTSWMVKFPQQAIPEYSAALYAVAGKSFPSYKSLVNQCFFKISKLPANDSLRNIPYKYLGQLIKVRGVVTHLGPILTQLRKIFYKCLRCGFLKGPFYPADKTTIKLGPCTACHVSGPYSIARSQTVYRFHQTIHIQESPSEVAPGRVPRGKEAVLFGDSIDTIKPGDEVDAIGTFTSRYNFQLNMKQGFPIFQTFIEINNITPVHRLGQDHEINQQQFESFAKEKHFAYRFYHSIAPSIYGHGRAKRAITLALFGGVVKDNKQKAHRTRGDINVLLLGQPGIAKSQFLKSIQRIFPRCVYTTGKGASAVGLTAAVKMDPQSKQWRLQAGAMVLADKGVCLIDEFDKMSEQDRTSIHEAMEQQTISISKAGIVSTLNARCSVIAAANPTEGYYNQRVSFRDNVELSEPILSRFDLLCVMKDRPSQEKDSKLADFVINQHLINHPYRSEFECPDIDYLPQEKNSPVFKKSQQFIKQYIKYARLNIQPVLSVKTNKIIKQAYVKLRQHASQHGGLSIVTRHLEAMIRLAQAHAKMHLRKETNQEDANIAVATLIQSFMDTQRHSVARQIKNAFKRQLEHKD